MATDSDFTNRDSMQSQNPPHNDDNLNYEEYVDGLRKSNADMLDLLKDLRSKIKRGSVLKNEKIYFTAEDFDRLTSVISNAAGGASVAPFESEEIICADEATARAAFERAIAAGILSEDHDAENAAADFMFMGTLEEGDAFKHIDTRRYVYNKQGDAA